MKDKALICPTCSGQMTLTEVRPGDKIAKCEYCNTIVDLADTTEKQDFDFGNSQNSNTTITATKSGRAKMLILLAVVVFILMMGTVAIIPLLLNK